MKTLGEIAEAQFVAKAIAYGYSVSIPFGDNQPYDLILDANNHLYKVQVKSTNDLSKIKDRSIHYYKFAVAKGASSKIRYKEHEVDLYALYIHSLDMWYLIPHHVIKGITVRLGPHLQDFKGNYERYRERWQILFEN